MFDKKVILITGGTGSFGNAFLRRLLKTKVNEVRILSRDEKKQDDMRKEYSDKRIKFYIGDVRDASSISPSVIGSDYIFHAAALKQVPTCEFFPLEAVKTNIIGTENVLNQAINHNVEKVICLSTDKAVYPINAMGISKSMMEKVFIAKSRTTSKTVIAGTRYGNVLASRGSVIPLFIDQILSEKPLTITDPNMTRFIMTLDQAIDLVIYAFSNARPGEIYVQKSPAATIDNISKAILRISKKHKYPIDIIGTRHGEKLYEVLLSREEKAFAREMDEYFCISPDLRDLNYEKFIEKGDTDISLSADYNSSNTNLLDLDQLTEILTKLPLITEKLK